MQIDSKIVVLNYNEFNVLSPTSTRTYTFEPAQDGIPTMNPMPYSDVEFINSQSNAFRSGLLFFKKEQQEEVYKELKIYDWKDILINEEIENMLLNPTIEKLQKIININDGVTFDRVRGLLIKIKNSNSYDLSNRVINVIERRHKEIQKNILKSKIILQARDVKTNVVNSEEVDSLKVQLAEMKKMMAQMMENQNNTQIKSENKNDESKADVKKTTGKASAKNK